MKKEQVKPEWANLSEGEPGIDIECLKICEAMNKFPGIGTTQSCCGHNKFEFRIWFASEDLKSLPAVIYFFDRCHCGFPLWKVVACTDCSMSPVKFMVEGPKGTKAYDQANKIAELMEQYLSDLRNKNVKTVH